MHTVTKLAVLPVAALVVACGRSNTAPDRALSEQLRSDLDRAAAPTSDLAAAQFRPTQTVSAIELGRSDAPRATPVAHKRPVRRPKPAPTPEVKPVEAVALEPSPAPTTVAVAPAPAPAPLPAAGPRPTPNPASAPAAGSGSGAEEGEGHGGGIGAVIGVIIRGGVLGDDDHCQRRPPIMINSRIPPMGHPTFPARGGPVLRASW